MVAADSAAAWEVDCAAPRAHRAPAGRKTFSSSISQAPSGVMQKQCLQTGLGNVNVVQFEARRLSGVDNRPNHLAAAAGIYVYRRSIGRAHLGHTGQFS